MSTHTPGPWDQRYFDDAKVIVVGPKKGQGTKRTLVATLTGPEREANGNLLVAAPDLLEALGQMVRYNDADPDLYSGDNDGVLGRIMFNCRTAIAKAEGGEV